MRLFVTGGAGFIGSNFVRMALDGRLPGLEDAHITVFDALTYSGTLTNLESVKDSPRLSFVQGDIRDTDAVGDALPVTTPSSTSQQKATLTVLSTIRGFSWKPTW